jgi:hypothetical protein
MRNAIPRRQLGKWLGNMAVLHTCVEPAMFHLAYRSRFVSLLAVTRCGVAYQCQILVDLKAVELDTLFLCNSDRRGLGQCEQTNTPPRDNNSILSTSLAWSM